jgi:hypothetical protein
MTFLHTRDGIARVTTCVLCGMSTRSLSEAAIYLTQRSHDAMTCQMRRAEKARTRAGVVYLAEPPKRPSRALPKPERTHCANGHDWTPENVYTNPHGHEKCRACSRERAASKYAELRQEKEAS